VAPPEPEAPWPGRHLITAGYGYFSPPVEPFATGQGVTLGYAYRFRPWLLLGGRAGFAFSDHTQADWIHAASFRMRRVMVQAEAMLAQPVWRRLEVSAGLYLGWQLALVTRDELRRAETDSKVAVLYGDPAGFRTGVLGSMRLRAGGGWSLAASVGWGLELLHESQQTGAEGPGGTGVSVFLRPQAIAQVGYEF